MGELWSRGLVFRLTSGFIALMLGALLLTMNDAEGLTTQQANVQFVSASTNDPPGKKDPGYTKDVAECRAALINTDKVAITISNGYPSYTCTFTVTARNTGRLSIKLQPLEIIAPDVLTVLDLSGHPGILLEGGKSDVETFSVHVEQRARQGAEYTFVVRKPFRLHQHGTIGFWKNWDSHKTFSKAEIEGWLVQINNASQWFGPTTTSGMVSLINQGTSGSSKDKFLAQCLATRLNERSGIFDGTDTHNVTSVVPGNYLGLATPSSASLNQILARIEAKFGTSPTNAQYLIMKDVCDKLNNLQI
jgi:hypothetical protein